MDFERMDQCIPLSRWVTGLRLS